MYLLIGQFLLGLSIYELSPPVGKFSWMNEIIFKYTRSSILTIKLRTEYEEV